VPGGVTLARQRIDTIARMQVSSVKQTGVMEILLFQMFQAWSMLNMGLLLMLIQRLFE
jgi:hypothetical protein